MSKKIWFNGITADMKKEDIEPVMKILDEFGISEIMELKKNKDLLARVKVIIGYSQEELLSILKKDYDLEITDCMNYDVYIGLTDEQEQSIPEWAVKGLPSSGWYFTLHKTRDGDNFSSWARDFLLQEVRLELWSRYLKEKSKTLREKEEEYLVPGLYV